MVVISRETKSISNEDKILSSGKNVIEFFGKIAPQTVVRLGTPSKAVQQPNNPELTVVGSPLLVTMDEKYGGYRMDARLTMPYSVPEGFNKDSLSVYV